MPDDELDQEADNEIDLNTLDADQLRGIIHELLDGFEALEAERDTLAEQAQQFEQLAQEGADREQEYLGLKARQAFDPIARELGVKSGLIEALWTVGKLAGDPSDAAAVKRNAAKLATEAFDIID